MFKKKWRYKQTCVDGDCNLFGVNIFDYEWIDMNEKITVIEPKYHNEISINVYAISIDSIKKEFAAYELSNCVWMIYTRR